MCPEKAKVFIAEDHNFYLERAIENLKAGGHEVIVTAKTYAEAKEMAPRLENLGIDVAILDGNFSPDESEGWEGQAILRIIREKCPNVKIIGFSGVPMKGVDFDLKKGGLRNIAQTVSEL